MWDLWAQILELLWSARHFQHLCTNWLEIRSSGLKVPSSEGYPCQRIQYGVLPPPAVCVQQYCPLRICHCWMCRLQFRSIQRELCRRLLYRQYGFRPCYRFPQPEFFCRLQLLLSSTKGEVVPIYPIVGRSTICLFWQCPVTSLFTLWRFSTAFQLWHRGQFSLHVVHETVFDFLRRVRRDFI